MTAAKRGTSRSGISWWTVGLVLVAAGLLAWWLSARRAEAPGLPASQPGARALSEHPGDGRDPAAEHDHDHDEITGDEKQDLERILRERGAGGDRR